MLYEWYEFQKQALAQASALAKVGSSLWQNPLNPMAYTNAGNMVAAALDVFAHSTQPYGKPKFGLHETVIDGRPVMVHEEIVLRLPFGQLKRFRRDTDRQDPKVLVVAPMSGHFATLLRGTVAEMLPDHDVTITDWRDAKCVPLSDGRFDLDDYIDYVIRFLEEIGEGAHVIAVCQPSVPVFAAVALMSEGGHPATPRSLTMMGGPIDTRQNPTAVNDLAVNRPLAWFEQNVIATVPAHHPGAGRRVYPGFLQLAGFMSMNLGDHLMSHWEMFNHLVDGDGESAEAKKKFYEEYRAVADMTAEFYLQTVEAVFQDHLLPKGELHYRGERLVDPAKIKKTALLAVEGERDDISGLGQTKAALTLATGLAKARKKYFMAEGVGHYGIFNGRTWRDRIAPVVKDWIARHNG
ncbi:polyhydroxyalkanoate depolymerase [Pedomonas mirosovicensis]|uniref:polyhydroxyalkanoate depolymerase n=1 Tax=Pedomonas mirosovicensis TaxID=2908641 RepID=UPI002168D723|nr:polyhydroxyalkanoate depolymerase [Pedomonas mirosovicensis]MCH8685045.1 polyhydroxyalkanoate depolymerase [Pedomonas mirosovicensis]